MLMRGIVFVLFGCWALSISGTALAGTYLTDENELGEAHRTLYLEAKGALDDWDGRHEELDEIGRTIDSFIALEKHFLPIYIEKARFLTRRSLFIDDPETANKSALAVVKWIQEQDPQYAKAHVLAGYIYTELKDYENAWKSLEWAQELGSEDPWLYYQRSKLLVIEKRFAEAVDYAEEALLRAKGDWNALVQSLFIISKHDRHTNRPSASHDIASLVFNHYHTPRERIRIAEVLISGYRANWDLLHYAQSIITRETEVTPGFPEADLQQARLVLRQGYRSTTSDHIHLYDRTISAQAEQILLKIRNEESVSERASVFLIDIALSTGDFEKAKDILEATGSIGLISEAVYKQKLGHLYFIEEDYERSATIYEELGYTTHGIQVSAYARLGRIEPLHELHRKGVRENPDDAWTLGNYALFLLTYMDDPDGAIEYGTRALAILSYGNARNTVGVAYLIKAASSNTDGDRSAAAQHVEMALLFGFDQQFVARNCGSHCEDVRKLLEDFKIQPAPA